VKRREFITLLGGSAAWPLAARAQQGERMRRISVLASSPENDPTIQARLGALQHGLQQSGWTDGRNVRIEYRWAAGKTDDLRNMRANWWRSGWTS
jgi:putative tryptophan/tyrosine transport system substrate-binding protein